MAEPPALRASDADREQAAALLRDAAADGRLTLEELTDRLERAWSATTREELVPVTADLVAPGEGDVLGASAAPAARARRRTSWFIAVMGGSSRRGRWRVGERVHALAVMGGVDVDLRNAILESGEVQITAIAVMGAVDVCVPEGVEVEVNGFVLMGGKDERVEGVPRPGAPVVRVRALGLMGGIDVHTPKRRRRDRERERGADDRLDDGADRSDR
ncbi:DUF1707 SHOCT-like domain-containing protein [Conexibacter woesei]|uniref:Uncharacterized protein n=1 Tax=Conexibacter woesei (strain DSM 14684 / CCUG 47730 / CIP 108061 / JCM 11494 / NBRC 100937 / ID131577) TaxID=469383 RepID=D3FEY0_CONWI|nr:DUF1707 domain-containing protein [Conexibacter woesei]ADB51697.1 protein of unknown function DUF1707 [Conexibacter woesei DSM 14684]